MVVSCTAIADRWCGGGGDASSVNVAKLAKSAPMMHSSYMRWVLVFLLLAAALCASAQDWAKSKLEASPRHQEWVELSSGSRTVKAFVAYPEKKDKATCVLLIHEIMGLTDWVMLVADELAAAGYIVVAPDFVSGLAPNGGRTPDFGDVGKVREAISGLPPAQIIGDLDAAFKYAKGLPSGNGKVAVGGFCWGGTQTFRYATSNPSIAAGFVFYGSGPTDAALIEKIGAPIFGFYGGNDNRVNATLPESEKLTKAAGKRFEPVIYEGAGHGFMRAGQAPDASEANKKARESAWQRLLAELAKL